MSDSENAVSKAWGAERVAMVCERCDWTFLAPANRASQACPHCYQMKLSALENANPSTLLTNPDDIEPELALPFQLAPADLNSALQNFARGIPYAPEDLNPRLLHSRLESLWLPMWLVDAEVQAAWQAEVGFNYEVVSHQEKYEQNRGGWSTRQVNETRTRWEPRLGRLHRSYQNISAPALEAHSQLQTQLGSYDLGQSQPYQAEATHEAVVRLPDRSTQDAWPDTKPALQTAAAEECRQAAAADYLRHFSWQAEFNQQNWSLLLLPVYSAYYFDDEQKPQPVFINGQNGKVFGMRRASPKRAQRQTITLLIIAAVLFLLSLAAAAASIFLPPILALGILGIVAAMLVGLSAIIPIATVWWFNRKQKETNG